MIRQTGGSAVGDTSTRSSSCDCASLQRLVAAHHSDLLAIRPDDAQLRGRDLFIAPDALSSWSSDTSYLQNNYGRGSRLPRQASTAKASRGIAPRSLPLRVRTANEFDPDFAVARDQQVRDPLQGVLADFKADFLVSQIRFDPKPLIFQEFGRLGARIRPARR